MSSRAWAGNGEDLVHWGCLVDEGSPEWGIADDVEISIHEPLHETEYGKFPG